MDGIKEGKGIIHGDVNTVLLMVSRPVETRR